MSDCGVCLYGADACDSTTFFHSRYVVAAKEYRCYECGRPITKGTKHELAKGVTEGEWWSARTCLVCEEIRAAFYCDGVMYGEFWSQFEEVMGELTTGCLDRLKTPEAKRYLMERWQQWKGLAARSERRGE